MNDEKAIEQLEEFLVIDDWSAVYMPYLQDAIEYVINRIKALEERPQGELTADESRLIGEAVDYLLGADLVEENGWSKNDIKVLQSLRERYYDEESGEEE